MSNHQNEFPPIFATNRHDRGETVAGELMRLFRGMREQLKSPPEVSIATAYINPGGFDLVADELEQVDRVRLLLGAEPDPATDHSILTAAADRDARFDTALGNHEQWLTMERDLLGFTRESSAAALRMLEWLRSVGPDGSPRVEVRRYVESFLHGKAFIADHEVLPAVLAGSSNFTYAGLSRNAELNLGYGTGNQGHVGLVREWFDGLWDLSEEYPLADIYSALWEPHQPWTVFLRMLWELYQDADDAERPRTELDLTGFQLDGVARMLRLLDNLGGVLVADEVGLGKTFLAGEIIARAASLDRQQVLIVCPAALKTGMWQPFLKRHDFSRRVDVLSYDELRLGTDPERPDHASFMRKLDDYALVVVDEAHNLRNPSTQRSAAVNALVGGARPKKLVLLTATPVNNSLMDLHTLVTYFVRNDAAFVAIGIPSIRDYVKRAQGMDPDSLSPEHLFDLMDQVAVRRTRRFVQRHYPHDTITLPDGSKATIQFPTPKPERIDYELDGPGEKLLHATVYALDLPDDAPLVSRYHDRQADPGRLMLARYTPSAYRFDEDLESYQVSNAGLLRSALLKRLESSPAALRRTLGTLIASHELFLVALDQGFVMTSTALNEWSGSEDESLDDWVAALDDDLADKVLVAQDFHVDELRQDVLDDLELLRRLMSLAEKASAGDDPKVKRLIDELRAVAAEARKPARSGVDAVDRRKVIIFSTYADTIDDVALRVSAAVKRAKPDDPLSDYQDRIADTIKGQKVGVDQGHRARVLAGFAPETAGELNDAGKPRSANLYDLIFTTDVLSEGVNLQQCGRIVNYDLPWNPMRLVQRHGRIDRIGSKHSVVVLGCFFPAKHLDDLLGLEATLQRKLAYADAAIGTGKVLPGYAGRFEVTLEDTRKQIEQVRDENPEIFVNGGASAALSGEEYRKRLSKAMDNPHTAKKVKDLPWSSGSGFANAQVARSGYVFCIRMGEHPKPWFRFVPVDPATWEPRRAEPPREDAGPGWMEGSSHPPGAPPVSMPVIVDSDTLSCLIAADPGDDETERVLPDIAYERAFDAWEAAREAALADWELLTDPNNLMPEPPKALRDAAELVYLSGQDALSPEAQNDLLARLNTAPPARVIRDVRAVLRSDASNSTKILAIRDVVEAAGLVPAAGAEPLPPLEPSEVHLITWMAVQGKDATET